MITKQTIKFLDMETLYRIKSGLLVGMDICRIEGRSTYKAKVWVNRINSEIARRNSLIVLGTND